MKLKVSKVDVWAATIEDRSGGLAEKLSPLATAGANFEFVIARRSPDQPGKGVVFVTPVKSAKQIKAATAVGFKTTNSLHSLRIEVTDKPGLVAKIANASAGAGISLRGLSAAAIGRKCICHLALDTAKDATKAISVLKKLG